MEFGMAKLGERLAFTLILPKKREKDDRQHHDHRVQRGQQKKDRYETALKYVGKGDIRHAVQQQQLGNDQREAENGHQRRALLRTGRYCGQEGEYQAQTEPAKTGEKDK